MLNCFYFDFVKQIMGLRSTSVIFILLIAGAAFTQKAPDFPLYSLEDNKSMNLSDYQGEVLYVSFWASWCKPCIVNFEKYEEMRTELDKMGVVLLNVNIDKTESQWTEAMDKHNIIGTHVRGKELDSLQALYELYSIPSYEIINKNGELVYLSDKPDRNILDEFRLWINE